MKATLDRDARRELRHRPVQLACQPITPPASALEGRHALEATCGRARVRDRMGRERATSADIERRDVPAGTLEHVEEAAARGEIEIGWRRAPYGRLGPSSRRRTRARNI